MSSLPDIILLGQTEESSDLCSTLGTKSLGIDHVGQTGDVALALLDDGEGKNGKIVGDDGAANRLSLALTGSARSVAGVAIGEEEFDTGGEQLNESSLSGRLAGAFKGRELNVRHPASWESLACHYHQ